MSEAIRNAATVPGDRPESRRGDRLRRASCCHPKRQRHPPGHGPAAGRPRASQRGRAGRHSLIRCSDSGLRRGPRTQAGGPRLEFDAWRPHYASPRTSPSPLRCPPRACRVASRRVPLAAIARRGAWMRCRRTATGRAPRSPRPALLVTGQCMQSYRRFAELHARARRDCATGRSRTATTATRWSRTRGCCAGSSCSIRAIRSSTSASRASWRSWR